MMTLMQEMDSSFRIRDRFASGLNEQSYRTRRLDLRERKGSSRGHLESIGDVPLRSGQIQNEAAFDRVGNIDEPAAPQP
jgi:hypothetical protein